MFNVAVCFRLFPQGWTVRKKFLRRDSQIHPSTSAALPLLLPLRFFRSPSTIFNGYPLRFLYHYDTFNAPLRLSSISHLLNSSGYPHHILFLWLSPTFYRFAVLKELAQTSCCRSIRVLRDRSVPPYGDFQSEVTTQTLFIHSYFLHYLQE